MSTNCVLNNGTGTKDAPVLAGVKRSLLGASPTFQRTAKRKPVVGESSTSFYWWGGIGVLLMAAILGWWRSGEEYPAVSSPESLHLMRALYTACSSRNDARLATVEENVGGAMARGLLDEAEYQAFEKIIALARSGDWPSATSESYRFAQDQVR